MHGHKSTFHPYIHPLVVLISIFNSSVDSVTMNWTRIYLSVVEKGLSLNHYMFFRSTLCVMFSRAWQWYKHGQRIIHFYSVIDVQQQVTSGHGGNKMGVFACNKCWYEMYDQLYCFISRLVAKVKVYECQLYLRTVSFNILLHLL